MKYLRFFIIAAIVIAGASATPATAQDAALTAPASAPMNSEIAVNWTGPDGDGDYVGIGDETGKYIRNSSYRYTANSGGSVVLKLPERPGDYSIVYVTKPGETLAFVPISVEPVSATLDAPDSVPAASEFIVAWTGPDNNGDYVAIGNVAGARIPYSSYGYTAQYPDGVPLKAPEKPGDYSVVYVTGDTVVEHHPLKVTGLDASIEAPASVPANSDFTVMWTGPDNPDDHITIARSGGTPIPYSSYGYTAQHPLEMTLKAPSQPGDYAVAYVTGSTVVTHVPLTVTALSATIEAPETVPAGSPFTVEWTGPDNDGDYLAIHTAQGARIPYSSYAYTALNPGQAELVAPEDTGSYTIAYVTGDAVVTTTPVTVVEVTATLRAEEEVDAGVAFPVDWTGPGNRRDVIDLIGDDRNFPLSRGYVANGEGQTVMLDAPPQEGDYELRYMTPGGKQLATRPISVAAPPEKPGRLLVLPVKGNAPLSALEVVLDASGSMLQRQDGARRIDIAKATLSDLLNETVPPGTPFALRVFGHREADSCRTDLEIPLAPLDAGAVLDIIEGIEAMNLAKTPIAASLDFVGADLQAADGERVVILITDGEETCEGDPAAAISRLRGQATDLRINIVGYAIDDNGLAETFANWADLGGGDYFSAGNREQLSAALIAAAQPKFAVVEAGGAVVARGLAGGDPVTLMPGDYEVRFEAGGSSRAITATIRPEMTTELVLNE
ncbi:VWA domain-containing protein [Hoeflea sp. CAU 1731]